MQQNLTKQQNCKLKSLEIKKVGWPTWFLWAHMLLSHLATVI